MLDELRSVAEENSAELDEPAADTDSGSTTQTEDTATTTTTETEETTTTADEQAATTEAPESTSSSSSSVPEEDSTTTSEAVTEENEDETTTTVTQDPTTTVAQDPDETSTTTEAPEVEVPVVGEFEVLEILDHDVDAFTQGLEISDGRLFESTGLVGRSSIRELDLATGNVIRSTAVPEFFAEGLTIVGDTAIQLTWQDEIALRYDLETFEVIETYNYEGEGWGLCLASEGSGNLIMSDGSAELEFRDPDTFQSLGSVEVLLDGTPINRLNELECVGDTVWANIWLSDLIVEINPATGTVLTVIDAAELRPESTTNDSGAVLNGIAYDPTDNTLLVTGKLWPVIYRLDIDAG